MNSESVSCLLQLSYQAATLFNYFYLATVDTKRHISRSTDVATYSFTLMKLSSIQNYIKTATLSKCKLLKVNIHKDDSC